MKKIPGRTYVRIGRTVIAINDNQVKDLKRMGEDADKRRKKEGPPLRNISQESMAAPARDAVTGSSDEEQQIPLPFMVEGGDEPEAKGERGKGSPHR